MSIHRSLKTQPSALNQHRNVLTRNERIVFLTDKDRFTPGEDSPMGLPKVISRKPAAAKKKKAEETEEGAEAGAVEAPEA